MMAIKILFFKILKNLNFKQNILNIKLEILKGNKSAFKMGKRRLLVLKILLNLKN